MIKERFYRQERRDRSSEATRSCQPEPVPTGRTHGVIIGAPCFRENFLPAHAVQRLREDLRRHAVLMLQDQALLQGHRHRRAVFGAFTAGETNAVQPAADLRQRERPTGCYRRFVSQLVRVTSGRHRS